MTIGDMNPGDRAIVRGYEHSNDIFLNRLITMGLTRGTAITMVKKAPLGDPAEIEVRGFRLSLRQKEASVLDLDEITK